MLVLLLNSNIMIYMLFSVSYYFRVRRIDNVRHFISLFDSMIELKFTFILSNIFENEIKYAILGQVS